jgi:organic radical activating enzyme
VTTYTVNESFYTWQGEGEWMGHAAYFIRLQGCDQACAWCDAASTWHKDHKPSDLWKGDQFATADLVNGTPDDALVVLTGGEPCLYDLDPLVRELNDRGRAVHIETAGHRPLPTALCWVTLSPKPDGIPPLPESVAAADEFKVIVSDRDTLERGLALLDVRSPRTWVWLHPEWSKRNDPEVLSLITDTVKANPSKFRAGWQVHKNYRADLDDPGARTDAVPLGGTSGAPY